MHNGRLWAVELPSGHARRLTRWVGDLFPQGLSRDGHTEELRLDSLSRAAAICRFR
jgi:hypothetical protein